jgi:phosphatidylinositol glycan class B
MPGATLPGSSTTKGLILGLIAFRVLNALVVETFHVPDEYWQSTEVAHRAVFGYGFLTWEWQPHATLRSFLHPAIFAFFYQILAWTSLDRIFPVSVVLVPKIVQGLIAAVGDVAQHAFVSSNYGSTLAMWFTIVNCTNWFLLHNITRPLANSIETSLFSLFVLFWPFFQPSLDPMNQEDNEKKMATMVMRRRIALVIAGITFLLRPTSAVNWALFAAIHLYEARDKIRFLLEASIISIFVLLAGGLLDSAYYGGFVSPLLQFLRFNFLSSGANHYGSHPFHWYITQGVPMLMGPYVVPMIFGALQQHARRSKWAWHVWANVLVFSLIGHKEARFLMPLIPTLNLLVAHTFKHWWMLGASAHPLSRAFFRGSATPASVATEPRQSPRFLVDKAHALACDVRRRVHPSRFSVSSFTSSSKVAQAASYRLMQPWLLVPIFITASVGMAIYTSSVHQRGTIDLMTHIRNSPEIQDLLLLMPCHHTPGLAYVHRPSFKLDYLDCSPGLPPDQLDEADVFYDRPGRFLDERFHSHSRTTYVKNPFYTKDSGLSFTTISEPMDNRPLPTHVALYDVLVEKTEVQKWLDMHHFELVASFFHTHAPSGRVGGHVLLYRRS